MLIRRGVIPVTGPRKFRVDQGLGCGSLTQRAELRLSPEKSRPAGAGSAYDRCLAELLVVVAFFIAAVDSGNHFRGATGNPEEDAVTRVSGTPDLSVESQAGRKVAGAASKLLPTDIPTVGRSVACLCQLGSQPSFHFPLCRLCASFR